MIKKDVNALDFAKYMIEEEHKQIQSLLDKMEDADLNYSIGEDETIGKRLQHMSGAEYRMSSYVDPSYGEAQPEIEVSVSGLKKGFEISKNRHLTAINNMKIEDLNQIWVSPRSGNEFEKRWLVYHFIEHLATHRGQITMSLRLSKSQ